MVFLRPQIGLAESTEASNELWESIISAMNDVDPFQFASVLSRENTVFHGVLFVVSHCYPCCSVSCVCLDKQRNGMGCGSLNALDFIVWMPQALIVGGIVYNTIGKTVKMLVSLCFCKRCCRDITVLPGRLWLPPYTQSTLPRALTPSAMPPSCDAYVFTAAYVRELTPKEEFELLDEEFDEGITAPLFFLRLSPSFLDYRLSPSFYYCCRLDSGNYRGQ